MKGYFLPKASEDSEAYDCLALLGQCGACLHWGNSSEDEGQRVKSCNCPKFKYGYRCKVEDIPIDGAAIEDDEGWGMLTGPEFGCIHWKSKEH